LGTLFDGPHILYLVISLGLTAVLLVLAKKALKNPAEKGFFLKLFALLTFFLHTSILWVDFLKNGSASVPNNILFPIFFCNLSMYMLVISAFWENKQSKAFQAVAIMTAYGGFFGAMISLFYPDYYLGASSMLAWPVLKRLLSHSTMLVGSLWILIGEYVRIRPMNTAVYAGGLVVYGLIGMIVNYLFEVNGLSSPNAMFLQNPPLAEAPFLSSYTISAIMVGLIFLFTKVYAHQRVRNTGTA
jgi:hypothetical protein